MAILPLARLAIVVSVALGLASMRPSDAAWSGFAAIGSDTVVSDISCAADGNGTGVCTALGAGSALMVARFNGTAWSGWRHLSGALTSAPSCTNIRTAGVICGARNANLQFVAYLWNGTTWSAPLTIAAGLLSGPSCAALTGGKAICAARSSSGGIASAVYSGTGWALSSWTLPAVVPDALYSPLKCTPDDAGHALCAYLSKASVTYVREFGTVWSAPINIGGMASKPPSCTDAGVGGRVACFALGTDSGLYDWAFAGGTFSPSHWSGYGGMGGLANAYSCAHDGQKAGLVHYACAAVALTDSALYTNEYNGSAWSGWTVRSTAGFLGSPACFALNNAVTPGKVMCALATPNNEAFAITGP